MRTLANEDNPTNAVFGIPILWYAPAKNCRNLNQDDYTPSSSYLRSTFVHHTFHLCLKPVARISRVYHFIGIKKYLEKGIVFVPMSV
jgi:hypothetical protein